MDLTRFAMKLFKYKTNKKYACPMHCILLKYDTWRIFCFFENEYVLYHYTMYLLFQDSNFTTALELAVRFGKTLIIQEMDGIEPILYPILRGDLISQGMIRLLTEYIIMFLV